MTATAFALIGDRFHNSDYLRTGLSKVLAEYLDLAVDFTDDLRALSSGNLASYDLLIIFRAGMVWPDGYGPGSAYPGYDPAVQGTRSQPPVPEFEPQAVQWITSAQGKAVRTFVDEGKAALFYHNSTYITASDDFSHVQGSCTEGHPPVRAFVPVALPR